MTVKQKALAYAEKNLTGYALDPTFCRSDSRMQHFAFRREEAMKQGRSRAEIMEAGEQIVIIAYESKTFRIGTANQGNGYEIKTWEPIEA